jgi:hypothetical protein
MCLAAARKVPPAEAAICRKAFDEMRVEGTFVQMMDGYSAGACPGS